MKNLLERLLNLKDALNTNSKIQNNNRNDEFVLEETWEDKGAGMWWTTIVYHHYYANKYNLPRVSSHQVLNGNQMQILRTAETVDYISLAKEIIEKYPDLYGITPADDTVSENTDKTPISTGNIKGNYLLITTDGYSLDDYAFYNTLKEAQNSMEEAYERCIPEDWNESDVEMSYCSNMDAILYCNGENIFVWNIIELVN